MFTALLFLTLGCRPVKNGFPAVDPLALPLPHAEKGYELYSWMVEGDWHFTLITGTNRLKRYDEIVSDENIVTGDGWTKITVKGVGAIKATLTQLPAGEPLLWTDATRTPAGSTGPPEELEVLDLPPPNVIDELKYHCRQLGLELQVRG